ncbi:MAG: hypothetical protein R2751_11115 [Bacteroidales bacterium]
MSFGVMGGAMQLRASAQIVVNLIDFGMNLQRPATARDPARRSSEPQRGRDGKGGW